MTREELYELMRAADAAGDAEAVQRLLDYEDSLDAGGDTSARVSGKAAIAAPRPNRSAGQLAGVVSDAIAPYAAAGLAGAAAGSVVPGVGTMAGAAGGPVALGLGDLSTMAGNAVGSLFGAPRAPLPSETIRRGTRALGITQAPQTGGQRVLHDVVSGTAGAATGALGFGTLASRSAPGVARNVFATMATQPGMQTGAGAVGALAPSVAQNAFGVQDPATLMALGYGGSMAGASMFKPKLPTTPSGVIKQQAQALYRDMEDQGVRVNDRAMKTLAVDAEITLRNQHYDPATQPAVRKWLSILRSKTRGPVAYADLDAFHSDLMAEARTITNTRTKAQMETMGSVVERFLENIEPGQTTAGNTAGVAGTLKQARQAWAQSRKAQTLEDAFARAQNAHQQQEASTTLRGQGEIEAVRREFRKIVNNPKQFRWFNAEEQKAIKQIANGTPTQRAMSSLSYLAPSSFLRVGAELGVPAFTFGMLGANPAVGFGIGAGAMGLGAGAKRVSNAMTRRALDRAQNLITSKPPSDTFPVRVGISSRSAIEADQRRRQFERDVAAAGRVSNAFSGSSRGRATTRP